MARQWVFECTPSDDLPARAWVARVGGGAVVALCGRAVRIERDAIFEGTWSGPADLAEVPRAATVFGSGIIADGSTLTIVCPAHTLEPVFWTHTDERTLVVSNSLTGLLAATSRELAEGVNYPARFVKITRGLSHASISVPTTAAPVTAHYHENLAVAADGSVSISYKRREQPFSTFAEYRDLLVDAVASSFANAPAYQPLATISSGYDSTASAAVGASAGCRRAASFVTGWPWRGHRGTADSGAAAAASLGMSVATFDRLAYLEFDDAPEAEFLATGMSGEDVVLRSMEQALAKSVVLTGFWGGAVWSRKDRRAMSRLDISGASMAEFRLRADFIHLPVPFIGGLQEESLRRMRDTPEMRPYAVGGAYDAPVPRRLAEEAGVRRGSFATGKLAATRKLHALGLAGFSASGRASFEAFAGSEALRRLPSRAPIGRRHRLALRVAKVLHADRAVSGIAERQREGVHLEPVLGSLLLRWAVHEMSPRYSVVRGFGIART